MTLLSDIKKKGNILSSEDLSLLQARIIQLKLLISNRLDSYDLPKSRDDIIYVYCRELKDINSYLKKCLREVNDEKY